MTTQIKKNDEYRVIIEGVTEKGFGIGKIESFTVFVEGALTDDELLISIVKVKPRYAYGRIVKIINPSSMRVESNCVKSDTCGGCQWQNCEYSAQLKFKKQIVFDALTRIGGLENPLVLDTIGMSDPMRYRNKAVFSIAPAANEQGFAIGMYASRSHRIAEIADCLISHEKHIEIIKIMSQHMTQYKIPAYDELSHKGLMRHVTLRTSCATGESMLIFTINGGGIPYEREFVEALSKCSITTILLSIHRAKNNVILGKEFRILTGDGYISDQIGDVKYQLSAPSFFQVNPVQTKVLYDTALTQAGLGGLETVLDAHCGVGSIALYAAKSAKQVIGVDIVEPAIIDARNNAELNNIENVSFFCGDAEEIIPRLLNEKSVDVVFLDPPRKGCGMQLIEALIDSKPPRIVYVSCDPGTLARDVSFFIKGGYRLAVAQPVDMFPMTGKVEVSCLLEYRTQSK